MKQNDYTHWFTYHFIIILRNLFTFYVSHFKRYLNLYLEFVPQLLFLMCIFGWLVFLVFFKWSFFYNNPNQVKMNIQW